MNLKKHNLKNAFGPEYRSEVTFGHGLFDYFTRDRLILLLSDIADIQAPGAPLVSSNILYHNDRTADWLMKEIGNWKPKKRHAREYQQIFYDTGRYEIEEARIVSDKETYTYPGGISEGVEEPPGFHVLVTARKKT